MSASGARAMAISRDHSADGSGRMNPERLQRLRRSPSNEEMVYQKMDGSPLPRKGGATRETAPVPAALANSKSKVQPSQEMPLVVNREYVSLPPISVMTGIHRSRSPRGGSLGVKGQLDGNGLRAQDDGSHNGEPNNSDTLYLESLLEYHRFKLTVQPWASKAGSMSYSRIITHAGLLLNKFIQTNTKIPVLNLPALTHIDGKPVIHGELDQSIRGQVLEEIWSSLTPTMKYSIARQLRKIVTAMRAVGRDMEYRMLGSACSGTYSIMMDKHRKRTYWFIQERTSPLLFVSFLQATFAPTVPRSISSALAQQFRAQYSLVLSHGELAPRSIVIDNNKIVAILGWNCSGWYPEWWDYVKFFETATRAENRDWYDYAAEIFEHEYPNELAAYQGFARCQKP